MTPPSDNDDDDRTQIGVPMPPPKPAGDQPAQPEVSAPPVQQPPTAAPPVQQPPGQQPPAGGDEYSGWTEFGAPLPDPTQQPPVSAPPISTPPISAPPISTPPMGTPPISTPAMDPNYGQPPAADPAAPYAPGPGEAGWVPGGDTPQAEAPAPSGGPPGPGEPGWVPGGGAPEAEATPAAPGPGEPGWVPGGGAPAEAEAAPEAPSAPGPGEPGWVPGGGGAPEADAPTEATSAPAAPGPGEPGWVPGGTAEPAPQASVPPADPTAAPQEATAAPPPVDPTAAPEQTAVAEPDTTQAAPPPPVDDATAAAPAAAAAAAPRRPRRGDGPTLDIGTVINNNYRIDQVLKAGGMGEVYRGAEVGTGDPVAIKVILPELAEDEKVGQMFKREARTLRQLQDEAIVRYYNYVHDPDLDAYCLVMAFISGVPLSDHTAKNGPISVDAGKTLLRRLAKGLEKAHDLDVIHRDLSPDNVMLPDAIVAEAVLIDFGIAKSNVEKEHTMAGQFAGKFRYVSPEQLGHFGGEIGPQSDIYSLALLMAAALIGTPLEMGSSIVEAVQSRQSVPDLSAVPPDLRPILMHMLEPDPANRPQTMGDITRLMDFPEQIPLNYRQGLPLPNTAMPNTTTGIGGTTGMGVYRPPVNQVSGLQQAPTTATTSGTATPTDLPTRKRAGGGLGIALILTLALIGGGGYYGFTAGWFDGPPEPDPDPEPVAEAPERLINTREGFLATFNSGGCTYATRVTSGENSGMIAGFSSLGGAFDGLPGAFEEKFGNRPAVLDRSVTEAQCAALTLARSLQGTNMEPITMELSSSRLETGGTLEGTITDPDNRPLWLVLITPGGEIFNVTSRLSAPIGDERTFRLGLTLPPGSDPAPQLLMAIASEEPLVRAAAARDRTPAADLFPLIQREIDSKSGRAVSALNYVLLTPPAPDIAEELEGDVDDDDDGDGND